MILVMAAAGGGPEAKADWNKGLPGHWQLKKADYR
jgi:hypothetical protein